MVAFVGKKKRGRVIITRKGPASAVLASPEELETLAQRLVEHEDIFKTRQRALVFTLGGVRGEGERA